MNYPPAMYLGYKGKEQASLMGSKVVPVDMSLLLTAMDKIETKLGVEWFKGVDKQLELVAEFQTQSKVSAELIYLGLERIKPPASYSGKLSLESLRESILTIVTELVIASAKGTGSLLDCAGLPGLSRVYMYFAVGVATVPSAGRATILTAAQEGGEENFHAAKEMMRRLEPLDPGEFSFRYVDFSMVSNPDEFVYRKIISTVKPRKSLLLHSSSVEPEIKERTMVVLRHVPRGSGLDPYSSETVRKLISNPYLDLHFDAHDEGYPLSCPPGARPVPEIARQEAERLKLTDPGFID